MRYVKYPVEYKEWVTKTIRQFKLRVKINDVELTTNDIVSIRINSDLFSGDTFTIGSKNLAKLSTAQKKVATNKNWTVV